MQIIPRPGYLTCEVIKEDVKRDMPERIVVVQVAKDDNEGFGALLGVEILVDPNIAVKGHKEGSKLYLIVPATAVIAHVRREEMTDA